MIIIINEHDGRVCEGIISTMACKESVKAMVNEHRLLNHKKRHGKLSEVEMSRMGELSKFLPECFNDFIELGIATNPFGELPEDTTQLYF
jgi:hypothetical protein